MTPNIRHPRHRDRVHGSLLPPLHAAHAICPRCSSVIAEDDRSVEVDCPGCGQAIRYESLEDRLCVLTERIRDVEGALVKLQARQALRPEGHR